MNIEEAFQQFWKSHKGLCYETTARSAFNAGLLMGHVAACGRVCSELDRLDALCGDGWHCEGAREIQELGR